MYFTHGKLKSWITINCIEWFHEMVNWYLNGKLKSYDQGKLKSWFNSKLKSFGYLNDFSLLLIVKMLNI